MTDISFPIISILIFLPIVGGISIYFINKITGTRGVQLYALLIGLIELVLSLYAYYVILNGDSGAEYGCRPCLSPHRLMEPNEGTFQCQEWRFDVEPNRRLIMENRSLEGKLW